ncbi:MAG: hypothetical protein JXR77_03210 [Lentisphaeria bacterium]|nr:hypothetical protein [Lentisphaeria bacterium]
MNTRVHAWRGAAALRVFTVPILAAVLAPARAQDGDLPELREAPRQVVRLLGEGKWGEALGRIEGLARAHRFVPAQRWRDLLAGMAIGNRLREPHQQRVYLALLDVVAEEARAAALPAQDADSLQLLVLEQKAGVLEKLGDGPAAAEQYALAAARAPGNRAYGLLHLAVLRFLGADLPERARTALDAAPEPARGDERFASLQGLVALYLGDIDRAAGFYPAALDPAQVTSHTAELLGWGRYDELLWLTGHVERLPPASRRHAAKAHFELRRLEEAESILVGCILDEQAGLSEWNGCAEDLVQVHAARLTLAAAVQAWSRSLERCAINAEERRRRVLGVLWRLARQDRDAVAALEHQVEALEMGGGGARDPGRTVVGSLWARAAPELLQAERCEALASLHARAAAVAPDQVNRLDGRALYARIRLGQTADVTTTVEAAGSPPERARQQISQVLEMLPVDGHSAATAVILAETVLASGQTDAASFRAALALACATAAQGRYPECVAALARVEARYGQKGSSDPTARRSLGASLGRVLNSAASREDLLLALLQSGSPGMASCAVGELAGSSSAETIEALRTLLSGLPEEVRAEAGDAVAAIRARLADADRSRGPPPEAPYDEVAAGATVAQAWVDPDQTGESWMLLRGGGLLHLETPSGRWRRVEDCLRPHGVDCLERAVVVFLPGLVCLGTDQGLFVHRREPGTWDRLRVPGCRADGAIEALEAVEGGIRVFAMGADGTPLRADFDCGAWRWTLTP